MPQLTSVVERMFSVDSEEERKSWVEAIEAVKEVCILHSNIPNFTILHYTK